MAALLDGLRVLVLEDEFLIAMDVEQLCLDNGAASVAIVRSLSEIDAQTTAAFDVAVIDLKLGGESTLDFARNLRRQGVPFVFASGYSDDMELAQDFPGAVLVPKPYSGADLVEAVAAAAGGRLPAAEA